MCAVPPTKQTDEQLKPGHTTLATVSKVNNQRNGGIKEESHQQSPTHGKPRGASTQGDHGVTPTTYNLAKYLARSQLVITGLTTFDGLGKPPSVVPHQS